MEPFDVADRKKRGGTVKAPFPYFGGKSAVADVVWRRFGAIGSYIEPFFGSGAVLLSQPANANRTELVNDVNCFVVNFWRAVQHDPEAVAFHAKNPINEIDYHARHTYLHSQESKLRDELESNPYTFNSELAGWWVWGSLLSIGPNWHEDKKMTSRPIVDNGHISRLRHSSNKIQRSVMELRDRLKDVIILCGEWDRCVDSDSVRGHGVAGVFLDPPYIAKNTGRDTRLYGKHDNTFIAYEVEQWCKKNEDDPRLRIALCGYVGDYDLPGWTEYRWSANGGYGNQGDSVGRSNKKLEVIYFSPSCLADGLFA